MTVCIPSKGRPGRVKSQAVISSARVFAPRSEAEAYRKSGTQNITAVPDRVRGITATRNYILSSVKDRHIVFIDDDVKACGWFELFSDQAKPRRLPEPAWLAEFSKLFALTEGLGYRIWGVSNDGALRSVYPFKPFLFRSYVTGSCMGVVNAGVRFDERFPVKEDYELCLRSIREDGGVVAARYLFWCSDHWTGAGGCKDYRTQAMEAEATDRLMALYPGFIHKVTRGGSGYSIELDF